MVATPKNRFAIKSAAPITIKIGIFFLDNPPKVRYLASKNKETINVVRRIVVIVIIALELEP